MSCEEKMYGAIHRRAVIARLLGGLLVLILPAIAAALDVAASRDKPFCERVLELFQKNMGKGARFNLDAEPFDTIKWEPAVIAGTGPNAQRCSRLDKALIDLDHNGTKDLVIKTTFCMKGAPSDSFYLFPADSKVLEQASWQDMSPLMATPDKFERTGGSYPLSSLALFSESNKTLPMLSTVFTVQPFLLGEKTYLALTDGRGEWTVIAKYLRGERFEDQCYLRSASN
jgi:hypothetical protein